VVESPFCPNGHKALQFPTICIKYVLLNHERYLSQFKDSFYYFPRQP
jgi:hypothetical protein